MPAPPADRDQRDQRDPVANRGAPPREAGAQRVPLRRLRWWHRQTSALPGFGLTMGYTLVYLSLIVLIPLATLGIKSAELSWDQLWALASSERALASYRITFGASLVAALVNTVFGTLLAWTLVRYRFPGRDLLDAIVDVPFALPTAVSGLVLTSLLAPNGWIGRFLEPLGITAVFSPLGIAVALTFIGLPFVVRTVQPILEELEPELEEAAAVLGATRWQTLTRVLFPVVVPAMLTGFSLAFARAIGEYGSVVFIAGNKQYETEITPLLILSQLEEHNYAAATALALVMLVVSFSMLLVINATGAWTRRRAGQVV
jgi:sulfate/thiosulfate transport system permease protein